MTILDKPLGHCNILHAPLMAVPFPLSKCLNSSVDAHVHTHVRILNLLRKYCVHAEIVVNQAEFLV